MCFHQRIEFDLAPRRASRLTIELADLRVDKPGPTGLGYVRLEVERSQQWRQTVKPLLMDGFFISFRAGQEALVRAVLEGRDVLAVMPTGSGKSLCYQLPAVVRPAKVAGAPRSATIDHDPERGGVRDALRYVRESQRAGVAFAVVFVLATFFVGYSLYRFAEEASIGLNEFDEE